MEAGGAEATLAFLELAEVAKWEVEKAERGRLRPEQPTCKALLTNWFGC